MEAGDYVRTDDGHIGRITFIYDLHTGLNDNNDYSDKPNIELDNWDECFTKNEIIKSSPNIIDLIEVGDILYLEESDDIACMFFKDIYLVKNEDNLLNIISDIKNKKCKLISIVSKEQFESMEYKVGD